VAEILKKFGLTEGKSASTPIDTEKPLLKDLNGEDVDVHIYISMIGSLIDYAGASLDRKSTTGGCQFLRCRLILWKCKKQTVVATSSTEAEYVDGASCCAQVLWIQNQILDYGLVQKQTALGKDKTNPLTVDSLLKTIWLSIHHLLNNEVLTILKQTATGVNTPRSDEDRLKLMDLTIFLFPRNELVGIGVTTVGINVSAVGKSVSSEEFNQIIDFLNGSYIEYALTVNPTIYVSCIKQFWKTVAVKSSNDVTRLQALFDKKKVVVTEAAIRDALHLNDDKGVDCLPNEEIFTELARMGYEKPSTKLTFYKAFFSSQWKFLIHTILQSISAKRTSWNEFNSTMASTVIFREPEEQGDVEEQGNDDNATEEPVTAVSEVDVEDQSIPSPTPPTPPPQQPQDIPSTLQAQFPPPQPQSPTPAQTQGDDFPMSLLREALNACAALARRVEHLEHDKVAQDLEIIKLKT
nr:ribonuclease H-like domain, reverse transcriptase, RNA-dependent DNA polymerase [Tanacetum cinerariifolium]